MKTCFNRKMREKSEKMLNLRVKGFEKAKFKGFAVEIY